MRACVCVKIDFPNTVEPLLYTDPMGTTLVRISEAIHFQWKLYIMHSRNLMNIINWIIRVAG